MVPGSFHRVQLRYRRRVFDKYEAPFSSLLRDLGVRLGATMWDDRGRVHLVKDGVDVTGTVRQIGRDPLDWLGTSRELLEMVAIPPSPGLPEFQIYLEDFSSFIGKLFGAKDLELGVSAFDIRYVVKGDDEARIRRCLPPERCTALVGMRTQALSCRGDRIELSCMTDFDTDPAIPGPIERTQNALELMFALASTDCYGNQLLAGLPDATFREAPLPYVDIAGPGEIRIGTATDLRG